VEAAGLALSVAKKGICLANALIQVNLVLAEAVVEVTELVSNVAKKATCLANAHLLGTNLELAEDLGRVSSVVKKAI